MTELVLDGAAMQSLADLHAQVALHPETPDDHGPNLDALFDVLIAYYQAPLVIRWHHAGAARQAMGRDFDRARQVFDDAVDYYREKGREARFELMEGAPFLPPPSGEGDHAQHGGGAPGRLSGPRNAIKRARALRSEMTLPESLLWSELRQRPGGFKFRRQHAAGDFILDFYCARPRLAIEVDGWVHDTAGQVRKDERRSRWLRSQGVATTRVPAKLIMEDRTAVVARVVQICTERTEMPGERRVPLHHPGAPDGPPPPVGEERA